VKKVSGSRKNSPGFLFLSADAKLIPNEKEKYNAILPRNNICNKGK